MTEETCGRTGCDRRGTHYCIIRAPAIGNPLGPTVGAIMGVALCRDHADEVGSEDLLTDHGRQILTEALRQAGRALPDFDRAFVDVRRIGDRRWNDLKAAQARKIN